MEGYAEIVPPTLHLFHLHHLLLGIWKERIDYVRALPRSGNVFHFSFNTKSFFLITRKTTFFSPNMDYTHPDISFLRLEHFVRVRAVITLGLCLGWEVQIGFSILMKDYQVGKGVFQNDHFCLETTNLSVMTQRPSKCIPGRSEAGTYKHFSPASTNGLHILRLF